MKETLSQKARFSQLKFTIEYNGIRIHEKRINKQFDSFVRFEDVPHNYFFIRTFSTDMLMVGIAFGVALFFLILNQIAGKITQPYGYIATFFCILIPIALIWYTRKEIVGFGTPANGIVFQAFNPSKQVVDHFVKQVQQTKKEYLREMYFHNTMSTDPQRESQLLLWLLEQDIISQEEFNTRMAAILPNTSSTTGVPVKSVGFRNN